jgi:preprotein translocase subunit SecA
MFGRRYSEGLHQAIEAKENVKVQQESQTLASITFQNYFRMYKKLSGMTGTAYTEAEEFYKIYGLDVTVIPTNQSVLRKDLEDSIYKTEEGKFNALIKEVKRRVALDQPILIGTVSVEKNELLNVLLDRAGVNHEILNAKNHAREAEIIAQAGRPGAVTVATNMAGRGVDIILGGQPFEQTMYEKVKLAGGLHVIGTERHESRRIDNQLRGRSGRQGDPGSTQFYISMEDDLMRIFGSDRMKSIMTTLKVPDDMPIENRIISKSIETAQKKIEGHNFDIRKNLVEYDDVINKHREAIYRKRKEILLAAENDINQKVSRENSKMRKLIIDALTAEVEQIVSFHSASDKTNDWNIKEIFETLKTIYPATEKILNTLKALQNNKSDGESLATRRTEIIEIINEDITIQYDHLEDTILKGPLGENIFVMRQIEKSIYLRSNDIHWIAHIDTLDRIRQGIGLRGYGQRDPLVEYKKEAYRLFNELISSIQNQVVYSIFKVVQAQEISIKSPLQRSNIRFSAPAKTMEKGHVNQDLPNATNSNSSGRQQEIIAEKPYAHNTDGSKVGRNDPCPCGSGKKYKKCHGL